MWTCWLIRRKVVSNQRNGSWSQGDKVRADGKMQQPLFHAIPRQHGPHCTASVYHHLQFALEFRKYPLGMALQLNVQFISHQRECVELITWDKQQWSDWVSVQIHWSPLQGILPNFLVTSTITHFMCFFPPSFLSLCLKPGSCSEWLTLVRFGEPLKQFHYLHEIGMIWMNVLYRITVRSFHRIPCFDSVSPDVCLGGPSAVRSIWIKL